MGDSMPNRADDQREQEPDGHQEYPQLPTRRRGRRPPRPTTASFDSMGAGDAGGEDQARGWQLHYSSTGHPFYFNRATGESAWARTTYTGHSRRTTLGNNHDSNNTVSSPRQNSFKPVFGSRDKGSGSGSRSSSDDSSGSSGSSGSGSGSGSSSSNSNSGTSLASSLSSGEKIDARGTSTRNSSEVFSTSSVSYASTGVSNRSRSSSSDADSRSSSSSSESPETSSESSWTGSLEVRFRRMITSEQGRKLLAEEVEALAARQARHAQRQSARGTTARPRGPRRGRTKTSANARLERFPGEKDDVEMALLGATDTESGGSSSSGSSSGSSETSSESSFSLHLSSGSDGGSDLSLLTSDVVLERLEKVEKVLTVARSTALSVLFASYVLARRASVFVWAAVWRGATRARRGLFSGRPRSRASSSFSPDAI